MLTSIEQARAVKEELAVRIGDHPSVAGIGLTRSGPDRWAVKVNLRHATPELQLPVEINGVQILTYVVGRIVAR